MDLYLERDLVFFDIEATGLSVVRDRIIQLAMVKLPQKGGDSIERVWLINPGVPISEEAMQVHGITPADVANKPTFAQLAGEIYDFIGNADLAGYNSNRFDVPMLMEEFARVGREFTLQDRCLVDVQRIFYKMEPRTLKAALKFYTGDTLEDAHDALADVKATMQVLAGQLERYKGIDYEGDDGEYLPAPIKRHVPSLHDFTNDLRFLDATQKLRVDVDGRTVFNFGKYQGKPVGEVLSKDKQYYHWILNKEFSSQVKQIVKQLVQDYERKHA